MKKASGRLIAEAFMGVENEGDYGCSGICWETYRRCLKPTMVVQW
jgi:hypothetical protein